MTFGIPIGGQPSELFKATHRLFCSPRRRYLPRRPRTGEGVALSRRPIWLELEAAALLTLMLATVMGGIMSLHL